ncbi:MAG: DUF3575 domain-containing protein [Bacteroidaceae bacterium]|nr:DUF3575 domain-containing protein [Bacteroidaceae bacterium]
MSHYKFTNALLTKIFVILLLSLCVTNVSAQVDEPISVSVEAETYFNKLVPKKDTTNTSLINKYREDKFIKRVSIHTNVVDWVTLVPNVGFEIDLSDSPRNNYSISVFGKYNGKSTHGSLVYNVGAVRIEGRKYWRTGKHGRGGDAGSVVYLMPKFDADSLVSARYHLDSVGEQAKIHGVKFSDIYANDTAWTKERKDSLDMKIDSLGLSTNSLRNWIYNTYNKVSREYTSGRSLDNPRNWRAYYFGLWAGYDNWNVSLTGNGKRGNGLGLGILGGYTLPLLPQKYPKEGSLDLDLGIALGVKAVNYDAYTYDPTREEGQRYVDNPAKSTKSWKVVPFPVIQDIHVSLIWRFRGIKNKVDKSLIDDYFKEVSEFESNRDDRNFKKVQREEDKETLAQLLRDRLTVKSDSAAFWNPFHLRRIENAKRINPDTVLTDADQYLYLKITENLDSTVAKKRLLEYKDSVVDAIEKAEKQFIKDSILNAKQAVKDSILRVKQEKEDRKRFLKDSLKASKEKVADTLKVVVDSLQMQTDSVGIVLDSKAAKKAAKAAQKAEKERLAQEKDSIEAAEKAAKKAEKESKKKDKKKKEKSNTPQDAEAVGKGADENVATEPKED